VGNKRRPRYTLDIQAPANGRIRKATITALNQAGKVETTDRADLLDAGEREKVAGRIAKKLRVERNELKAALETAWNEKLDERRAAEERAAAGSPEAANDVTIELMNATPSTIGRPLTLLGGRAYAAAWVPVRFTTRRSVDPATGTATDYDPPLVRTEDRLLIVTEDGQLYADGPAPEARPLAELGVTVRLPSAPPPGRGWSGAGVNRYRAGERPDPAETFGRLTLVVDRFLDFSRSLADQDTACELLACYVLATYLLDAFHVVGYLWPNGERGSGKTSFLHVVAETAYLGQLILAGSSYPCLRDLADYGATLCFDDAEAVMDVRRSDPDKRTLLLAGNRKGATIAVKEWEGERWVTRNVQTFCPRLFSAIKTPDEVLGSRSILFPLVRSGDPHRAKANVLDASDWPEGITRQRLVDDLWALGLANLRFLPAHDRAAAGLTKLAGRNLDPWRPILAVAHWLQECHGPPGLFNRMKKVAEDYQGERAEFEEGDATRVLLRALLRLTAGKEPDASVELLPKEIAQQMNEIAKDEELADADKDFTNPRRVGWQLKRQRFQRLRDRKERGKPWVISPREIETAARAYGIVEDPLAKSAAGGSDDF
jgi:hypothetical protein